MERLASLQADNLKVEHDAAFFHCIAEQAGDAILGISLNGQICYANCKATSLYGYSREEFYRMHARDLRAPETQVDFDGTFCQEISTGLMFRTMHVRKDGRTISVEINSRGIDLPGGRLLVSIIRDNTPHERLEADLLAAKVFSESLIKAANVMIILLDKAGRIRLFNETAQKITGYSLQEALGRDGIEMLATPDCVADVRNYFFNCLRPNYLGTYENPVLTKSGERRFIYWQNCMINGRSGMDGMLWFGMDVTERLLAEDSLHRQENFINGVVEGLLFPFFVVDRHYCYLAFNSAHKENMKRLFNADIELGGDLLTYHHKLEDRLEISKNLDRALAGEPCVVEAIVGEAQYKTDHTLIEHNPVRDFAGNIIGVAVVVHDINQLRNAEAELRTVQERYKKLVEEVPAIILVVGMDGKILYINSFGSKVFQFSADELIDRSVEGSILPQFESTGRDLWSFYRNLWTGSFQDYYHTNENVTRKGRRLWINWSIRIGISPLTGQQGWICMGVDVTEKHRALEMEKQKLERERQKEIMNDILSGRIPEDKAVDYLQKLGLDANKKLLCFAIRGKPLSCLNEDGLSQKQVKDLLLDRCRALSGGIAWDASGYIGVLISCEGADLPKNSHGRAKAAAEFWQKLQQCGQNGVESAGVALKLYADTGISELFFQACSALEFGPCFYPGRSFFEWSELGWLRLFIQNVNTPEARRFVQEHLGALLRLPGEEKREDMLETLKIVLEGKSIADIAKEINVHKQTVRYRVAVLKKLLGAGGLKGENGINIAIALRLYKLQNGTGVFLP